MCPRVSHGWREDEALLVVEGEELLEVEMGRTRTHAPYSFQSYTFTLVIDLSG